MLKKISINNFRNLKNITIEPALITLLIGANDSGKSGIFHSLLVLKQTLQYNYTPYDFTYVGDLINLGSRDEVVYDHNPDNEIEIAITNTFDAGTPSGEVTSSEGEFTYNAISRKNNGGAHEMKLSIDGLKCEIGTYGGSSGIPDLFKITLNDNEIKFLVSNRTGMGFDGYFNDSTLHKYNEFFSSRHVANFLVNNLFFVPVPRGIGEFKTVLLESKSRELVTSRGISELTKNLLSSISYDVGLVDRISVFMERLFGKKMRPSLIPINLGTLYLAGFGGQVDPSRYGTVDFYDLKMRSYASNTGFGLNQILFLFAQVLDCPKGSTIMIEEPEISLHPLAQKELTEILIEIAKSQNKQFIISTHSEHVAFALFGAKDMGKLKDEELSVYRFSQKSDSNDAQVARIDSLEGSLVGFLGNDPSLILRYVEAFGKVRQWLETGTVDN